MKAIDKKRFDKLQTEFKKKFGIKKAMQELIGILEEEIREIIKEQKRLLKKEQK